MNDIERENNFNESKIMSLTSVLDALGMIKVDVNRISRDVTVEEIREKVTNPDLARRMGASPLAISTINGIELAANLLDSYSETGDRLHLIEADKVYKDTLLALPEFICQEVQVRSAAALTYFYYEAFIRGRIERGDLFLKEEAIEYLLRRGADAPIYEAVLAVDGIGFPGLTAGFRIRQGLWDLEDDVRDLEEDRLTVGANILLLSTGGGRRHIRSIADSLFRQSRRFEMPHPLQKAIEEQYDKTVIALQ